MSTEIATNTIETYPRFLKTYYENGVLKTKIQYNSLGEKHGMCKLYHTNSNIHMISTFINGKQYGILNEYYIEDGSIIMNSTFINDEPDGLVTLWFKGRKTSEYSFTNGKKNGLYRNWHQNGKLYKEYTYINDKIHGLFRTWYDNGKLQEQVNYINGEMDGEYLFYSGNGVLMKKIVYNSGEVLETIRY